MSPRMTVAAAVVAVAALAAVWWAVTSRNDDEAATAPPSASAVAAGPAAASASPEDAGSARCLDRDGQLRAPLADGTCPPDRAGSRLAPEDSQEEIDGSCETDEKSAPAGSKDPVLAALSQGVCY
jgi:hypothetical protein